MRAREAVLCFAFLAFLVVADVSGFASAPPRITPLEYEWDFGRVEKGRKEGKTFSLKNTGGEELIIESVSECCGYIISDISSWRALPGGTIRLKAICDSSKKAIGEDRKSITVASNDPLRPKLKIEVRATIVAASQPKPAVKNPYTSAAKNSEKNTIIVPSISASKLYERIYGGKDTVVLDVREEIEYNYKHIKDAVNLPRSRSASLDEDLRSFLHGIDRNTLIAVHCGGGFRSSYIAKRLRESGYEAFNLEKGLKAWEEAGYPLEIGPMVKASQEPLAVGLEEAYEHYFLLFENNVVWVDVRDVQEYRKGHIQGAINVPLYLLGDNLHLFSKKKEIIMYCDGPDCGKDIPAARLLISNGFKHPKVKVLKDGYRGWAASELPIVHFESARR